MKKKKLMKKQSYFVVLLMLLLLFPSGAFAQQQMIKGQVVDDKGDTVIGATVMLKGTQEGAITDIDGNFSIKGKVGNTLTISYVGFSPLEVKVTKLEGNRFVLKEDSKVLDEVVVVGMDKQKRNTITAAVATVNEKAIVNRPVTDLTSALQGNVAGLNFASDATASGVGGETGAEIKFNIRGIGSINGGEPYVLVDGVEQSMQNVNPADIASISVLKDASASAVYGARAAYGVVLVTTKSGKKEKTRITYRGTVGFSSPINMPEMMNSLEFAHYVNERNDNMGVKRLFSDQLIEKMKGFMANPYSAEFPGVEPNQQGTGWAGSQDAVYANTDWFDYYFKKSAIRHSHNLNITGGSDKFNYYVGMGYTYQEGLLDQVEDNLSKYNINTKFQITANEWLKFNFNNNMTLNIIKRPLANQTIFYGTVGNAFPNRPTVLPVDSEYNLPDWNEFLRMRQSRYNQNRISDAMSFSAVITPLEGWDIVGEMKVRLDVEKNSFERGTPIYENPNKQLYTVTGNTQGYQYPGMHWKNSTWGSYTRGDAFNYYLSPNVSSSYTHQWGEHFFKAMAGFQMEVQENSDGYTYKDGMLSDDIFSFANANGTLYAGDNRTHWATMGAYARMNWNYQNVYFLEVSGRYDGSSRFAPGHRWGYFPSFSGAWRISEEEFMESTHDWLSSLKIRASWGMLGNQDALNKSNPWENQYYPWMQTYNLDGNYPMGGNLTTGYYQKAYRIEDLSWEKSTTWGIGLDAVINHVTFTFDYYDRKTTDIIMEVPVPTEFGLDPYFDNVGSMRNRGVEVQLGYNNKWNDWSLNVMGNMAYNKNKIEDLGGVDRMTNPDDGDLWRFVGKPIDSYYVYKADGFFQSDAEAQQWMDTYKGKDGYPFGQDFQAGDLRYVDTNGDGKLDADDRVLSKTINPVVTFGLNLNVGYKAFDLTLNFTGAANVGRAFTKEAFGEFSGSAGHPSTAWLDSWTPENTNASMPRVAESRKSPSEASNVMSDFWVINTSYLRLKTLQLGYTLPKSVLNAIGLSNVRVYYSAENLFTIDSMPLNVDPETVSSRLSSYPLVMTNSFGVNVTF